MNIPTITIHTDDKRFVACLPHTMVEEGYPGNVDDPHDPGGRTHAGIIQTEYNSYRKSKGEATQDVYNASWNEVCDIYYTSYWLPFCPKLPAGLDLTFFDNAVNEGPGAAMRLLQEGLRVVVDGEWGPQTEGAVASEDVRTLIQRYTADRIAYYRSLSGFKYFGTDWVGRANRIGQASLAMVGKAPTKPPIPKAPPVPKPKSPPASNSSPTKSWIWETLFNLIFGDRK